jgi:hypothetical protein
LPLVWLPQLAEVVGVEEVVVEVAVAVVEVVVVVVEVEVGAVEAVKSGALAR